MAKHKTLDDVNHEKGFTFSDGTHVKNLKDLIKHLEQCEEATFKHHVHDDGNDFCNWVAHVLEDQILSKSIKHVRSKNYLVMVLKEYIRMLEQGPQSHHRAEKADKHTNMVPRKPSLRHITNLHWGIEEFILGLLVGFLIALVVFRVF